MKPILLTIAICIHIALGLTMFFCCDFGRCKSQIRRFVSHNNQEEVVNSNILYRNRVELLKSLKNKDAQVLMLGDSLTEAGEWQEFFKSCAIVNRGIGRDTSKGLLYRIEHYLIAKPSKVLILIGINDLLAGRDVLYIVNNIKEIVGIIRSKSPETSIVIQSILPCKKELVTARKIMQLNAALRIEAKKQYVAFVDLYSKFIDKDGEQDMTYFISDGIHLSPKGYEVWVDTIKPFVLN